MADFPEAAELKPSQPGKRRALPVNMSGQQEPGRPSRNAKAVAAEYGWLTPLRKSKGDPSLWFFRCRCGTEVQRLLSGVRRLEKEGKVAKCSAKDCRWSPEDPAVCQQQGADHG